MQNWPSFILISPPYPPPHIKKIESQSPKETPERHMFPYIPPEIISLIANYLSNEDLLSFQRVSKLFYQITNTIKANQYRQIQQSAENKCIKDETNTCYICYRDPFDEICETSNVLLFGSYFQIFAKSANDEEWNNIFQIMCSMSNIKMIKYFINQHEILKNKELLWYEGYVRANVNSRDDVVELIKSKVKDPNVLAYWGASDNGHLEIIKWLIKNPVKFSF